MGAGISAGETNSQAAEVLRVIVQGPHAQDGVFSLYSVLAYPSRNEQRKRKQFVAAMKAVWDVAQGRDRKSVPAAYRIKNQQIVGQMNMGLRRISRRLNAAGVAYGMIMNGARIPYEAPAPDGSLGVLVRAPGTVNKAMQALLESKAEQTGRPYYEKEAARTNITHRDWASSMPVLHLAVVLFLHFDEQVNETSAAWFGVPRPQPLTKDLISLALVDLSHKERWLGPALLLAEKLRLGLPQKVPTFAPAEAVCLLPAENISES